MLCKWLWPLIFTVLPGSALAQSATQIFTGSPTAPVSAGNPLPVNASVTATTSATASSTPTTVSPGPGAALNVDLHSALFEQQVFAGQPVDGTHGLPVNCIVGCAGGSFNNNADGVATSATNGQTAAWLYAWNGATFDRLQDDASKNLKVNIAAAIAAGTNLIGKVGIDQTTPGSTNGAAIVGVNAATALAGAGATGSGALRVTAAQDTTTIAGSAPGTAGTASANVVTVQGIASMTKLLVTPDSVALPANQSVNVAQVGGTNTVNGGVAGSQSVGGTVATNVAITANPLNLGAQAVSSENTAVTTARQVQLVADLVGKLIVLPYANPENFVSGVTAAMTATTSTSLIAAPAAGLRNYITQCTFSNSHATVGTMMNLQDGSGGTTIYSFPAAPAYGGATVSFPTPLRQPTTATALFVVNATTGANTFAACSGYKGA